LLIHACAATTVVMATAHRTSKGWRLTVDAALVIEQLLNGLQLGVMLFLMAAGLTLIFGIMNFLNLAHGTLYMMGAYFCATFQQWTDSFMIAVVLALLASIGLGVLLDVLALRRLYQRSHFDQVLGTFALILIFNDLVPLVWGPEPYFLSIPGDLSSTISLFGWLDYPIYRLVITGAGLVIAAALFLVVGWTRLGMLIRAAANNGRMLGGLGVNVQLLYTFVFATAAALAGFAGMITGPLMAIQVGMGDPILIVTLIVIVIGGIGSVGGAFFAAIIAGIIDTMARFLLPHWFGFSAGPALASMVPYFLMAGVLLLRPQGLFSSGRS
jgi:branched-chain amino acid transport system permease protein